MKKIALFVFVMCCFSCSEQSLEVLTVTVNNTLAIDRAFETVEVDVSAIDVNEKSLAVINAETHAVLPSQVVTYDTNNSKHTLLFQPAILANAQATFKVIAMPYDEKLDSTSIRCFSRFVPERTDDYAWENNKVAFRTFGPVAQEMAENGIKGGTLTSGMDAWLKRVEYPIINNWYAKYTSGKGSYHKDTGEGLDNFHVGVSRGVGGIAVKTDDGYAVSKNFTSFKTITNGPIRTSFVLDYAHWNADGKIISEQKHISLDFGQNLSRHTVLLKGTDRVSIGLTLHKKDGNVTTSTTAGWMSYWEPFDDSELGQGVVLADASSLIDFDEYITDKKDQSNLYVQTKVSGSVAYYAGFGWKKAGQFQSNEAWNNYLSRFSKCLQNPLEVNVITPQ